MSAVPFSDRPRVVPLWKSGETVDVFQRAGLVVKKSSFEPVTPLIGDERVFAIDTESCTFGGVLVTDLVPMAFHDGAVLVDRRETPDVLSGMLSEISRRFGVPMLRPSRTKQRKKRRRASGRYTRDGRLKTLPPFQAVWFNMPYDIGRLFPDHAHLRLIHSGVDSFIMPISDRWSIEWERYIDGSAPQFSWLVRDHQEKVITRVVGSDLTGTWKTSLDKFLKDMGLPGKIPLTEKWPRIHETPFELFTPEMVEARREYAVGDATSTLAGHHAAARLFLGIDPRVVKKTGMLPSSAPGTACRIMFARSFDKHPDLAEWRGPPAWADRDGANAYRGGRAACPRPGVFTKVDTLDIKSAYPAVMAMLPDPVDVRYVRVPASRGFDVNEWLGRFGVLRVSGRTTDDVCPVFRVHEGDRLRYVVGDFVEEPITIPEIVMGVVRGALHIDEIHGGTLLDGSAERSFLRDYVLDFYLRKEKHGKSPIGLASKLFINSPYGKLIEVQTSELLCEKTLPVPDVRCHARYRLIVSAFIRCVLASDVETIRADDVWLGDPSVANIAEVRRARERLEARLARARRARRADSQDAGTRILGAYVRTLEEVIGVMPVASLREVARGAKLHRAGRFFMPIYASQITGFVSAQLGTMMACTGACAGDTDSSHFISRTKDPLLDPGVLRYFELMGKAGYPAPHLSRSDSLIGGTSLGTWAAEMPAPTIESIFVRPKRYSHVFVDPKRGGLVYKQATHGMTRFTCREADEERDPDLAKQARAAGAHEAMRSLARGWSVKYATRRAPRKGKEAVRTGLTVGEFTSHAVAVTNDPVPGTWKDSAGIVRWLDIETLLSGASEAAE